MCQLLTHTYTPMPHAENNSSNVWGLNARDIPVIWYKKFLIVNLRCVLRQKLEITHCLENITPYLFLTYKKIKRHVKCQNKLVASCFILQQRKLLSRYIFLVHINALVVQARTFELFRTLTARTNGYIEMLIVYNYWDSYRYISTGRFAWCFKIFNKNLEKWQLIWLII